ncbi:MAG: hypothetical protein KKH60_01580 [Proteobacteria bacterium]|nr:hypothetical protein [Pseudomonadota bacterium]MBU1138876.1 hypothetical protein [Pseudomonadota bacterium]
MADIKRVNYFTHQFLVEKDFDDEQEYHVLMRRRHNRGNHSWGVAEGLDVTKTKNKEVTISSGTAIDNDGQEIVLLEPLAVDLTAFAANTDVYVTVSYQEVFDEADHYTSGGVDNYTRITERPRLDVSTDSPDPLSGDGSLITLARVHLDGSGNVDAGIDGTMRKAAGSKIAPGVVGTNELADKAVTAAKIANGQVGASELANGSVSNSKLANNAVNAAKIAGGSVGAAELANNAVTTDKIIDKAVTAAKIANGQVGASELANGSVTNSKLADNAVNAAKIAEESVGAAALAKNAVTTDKIIDNAVTADKIAKGQVSASELANGSVINSKLANNAVNAAKILSGSVGTAELANDSVTVQKLKTHLYWDSTTSIAANAERGFNCLAVSLDKPRGASLLIYAYSTTNGARFEWREQSTTGGSPPYWINQGVYFRNLSNITISVRFKIYEILEN